MEIVGNTRTIVRLEAETSYLSKAKSSTSSELIPKNYELLKTLIKCVFQAIYVAMYGTHSYVGLILVVMSVFNL